MQTSTCYYNRRFKVNVSFIIWLALLTGERYEEIGFIWMFVDDYFCLSGFAATPQDNKNVPALMQDASVKTMIDLVSRSVARRYDLRPDQATVAHDMLLKNTQTFMQKHFNDLVVLIPKMQDMRMKAVSGHLSPRRFRTWPGSCRRFIKTRRN